MKTILLVVGLSTLLSACNYSSTSCGSATVKDNVGVDQAFIDHVCKQTKRANAYLGIHTHYSITLVTNDDALLNQGKERLAWATPDSIRIGVYPKFQDKTLFHEIRHIYQYQNGAKQTREFASYSAWSRSPEEIDANRFGRKAVGMWGAW